MPRGFGRAGPPCPSRPAPRAVRAWPRRPGLAVDGLQPALQRRLGLAVEVAQQHAPSSCSRCPDRRRECRRPSAPSAGPAARRLFTALAKSRTVRGSADVALLRHVGHQQVIADQPFDGLAVSPASAPAAARPGGRSGRRGSNDPRRGPCRCRAAAARHRAPCGSPRPCRMPVAIGSSSTSSPRSIWLRIETHWMMCSSTV